MDEPWGESDRRYAEWFAWAKREISADDRVAHGVAAAALEAQEGGAGEDEARRVARASLLGRAAVLAAKASPERRGYTQWYDWARTHIEGEPARLHKATEAALRTMRAGGDAGAAVRAARSAVGLPEDEPLAPKGDPEPEPLSKRHTMAPPPPPDDPGTFYAGFGLRLAAYLIDGAVLTGGLLIVSLLLFAFFLLTNGDNVAGLWIFLACFWVVVIWLYRAGMESSTLQGTVGKRIMGLAVVNRSGRRPSIARASLRFLVELVSMALLGLGFLIALTNRRRQALHDLMAGTLVVRREYASVAPAVMHRMAAPPPPPAGQPPQLEFRS
jgi:uncharacterized RDD family membrane protein YckC